MKSLLLGALVLLAISTSAAGGPIHDAAKKGDVEGIKSAIESGVDVNASNGLATPLYYAASGGHVEALLFLLNNGADAKIESIWGPPIVTAASSGNPDIIELLLAHGSDPNAHFKGKTSLQMAAEKGHLAAVTLLVEARADVNAINPKQETALHLAKYNKHVEVANYLVANGARTARPPLLGEKLLSGDGEKGRVLFQGACFRCHFDEESKGTKLAPNLWGVVGRKKASLHEYTYSEALKEWGSDWNYEDLNAFVWGPMLVAPGVEMQIAGIENEQERVDLIAYLRTLSANPAPMP